MFFSTASEGDDDGVGIAEDAANGRRGREAGEGVEVAESREIGHGAIVTGFRGREKAEIPTKTREFKLSGTKSYPHESPKSQIFMRESDEGAEG